jgi:RNA polymerase sigma-70 factor, ECF subfamily
VELAMYRPLLFKLCYRLTGSAADAEDLVQDTFARALEKPPRDRERDIKPWLVQVAVNLSRDHLRRRKRRRYAGPWLPSPIETPDEIDDTRDPEARYAELESISFAFLCAAEALTPTQRAVLILRDVLGYSVKESARVLDLTAGNVKTTHHRARSAMEGYDRERQAITEALRTRTAHALAQLLLHLRAGDARAIEAMLAKNARARNDSDGEFFAARVPITGSAKIATFHLKTAREREGGGRFAVRAINGLPAVVAEFDHVRSGVAPRVVFRIELDPNGQIRELDTILASAKLTHVHFDTL